MKKLMSGQRDDRMRLNNAGVVRHSSRIPLALRLHAQMHPGFFKRHFHGPATDQPGQDLLRCMVQVGSTTRPALSKALVGITNEYPAE